MKPRIRCSNLPQLLNCHGSRTLQAIVAPRDGDEGFEGVRVHFDVAARLISELRATAGSDYNPDLPDVPKDYVLPKMSEWMVDWGVRQVKEFVPPDFALEVEGYFEIEFERFILTGHMDVNAINAEGTKFIGMDWKTGYKAVIPAELNDQVLGYLVLAKKSWPTIELGKFIVGQPRNSEEDGFQRISIVELDGDALQACVVDLERRVNAALDDPMTVDSGMLQCTWCAAAGPQCPAWMLHHDFMKAQLTPEILASIKAVPDDARLADLVIASKTLAKGMEDAKDMLIERIKSQQAVIASDGTRITTKTTGGTYEITNPEGCWAAVQSVVPADRIPKVVKYSKENLIDEIATAQNIPKGGNKPATATKVFDALIRPNMTQSERTILQFQQN
jgi:hypothetical protein